MKQRIVTVCGRPDDFFCRFGIVSYCFFKYQRGGYYFFGAVRNVPCDRRVGE